MERKKIKIELTCELLEGISKTSGKSYKFFKYYVEDIGNLGINANVVFENKTLQKILEQKELEGRF